MALSDIQTNPDHKTTALKRLGIIAAVVLVLAFAQAKFNIIPNSASQKAVVPIGVELNTAQVPQAIKTGSVTQINPCPSASLSTIPGPTIRTWIWAWNAQMSYLLANCGPKTTQGSLMEKYGVKLAFTRQDNTDLSKPQLITFAKALASGNPNPGEGIHFIVIMGDGAASTLYDLNKSLVKLGPDYRAEIVGAVGYSGNDIAGEDGLMGPPEWAADPSKAKGELIAGVERDGDWNTGLDWENKNNLKNNPDDRYFEEDAVNWVNVDDYTKAGDAYINGYCETRPVINSEGKTTGQKATKCVKALVSWTPVDVNVFTKKGGLIKLWSTKQNTYQMPAVVIGIHKWDTDHAKLVEGMLAASFEAAEQVNHYDSALQRAGKASYDVYAEQNPGYWVKYYKGVLEHDRVTGQIVELGGSRVNDLGDNLFLFGLLEGSGGVENSPFNATYDGFARVAHQQYPLILPTWPKTSEAVNLEFLQALAEKSTLSKTVNARTFETGTIDTSNQMAKQNVSIQFDTGKATFRPEAIETLDGLYNQLTVSAALSVDIQGHTDNVGSAGDGGRRNVTLSLARAQAVQTYLQGKSKLLFPENRLTVRGFGDTQPIASNDTADGRAKNRRVTIILGTK